MLELRDVSRSFGEVRALRGVSLSVPPGATFGLLGPNGAGKTTTMRIILGILLPDTGSVTWNGRPVDHAMQRRFGYLPEERGIYGKMKVREQIVYFGRLHGLHELEAGKRADTWMERLGVATYRDRPCSELSKGNQQKVQVACAALHGPELLVMDEPFSGLDPVNAETLLAVLRELQTQGTTLVLSSHQMWQIEDLCTAFAVIAGGEVRVRGTLEELRRAWPTRVVEAEPSTPELRAVFESTPSSRALASTNGTLAFELPVGAELPALLRRLVAAGDVTRFERLEPSLQDIYLRAIGEEARP